jgi:hypothetical protein
MFVFSHNFPFFSSPSSIHGSCPAAPLGYVPHAGPPTILAAAARLKQQPLELQIIVRTGARPHLPRRRAPGLAGRSSSFTHRLEQQHEACPCVDCRVQNEQGRRGAFCGDPAYHCMCTMQVVDITPMKHRLTSITSIRVVQQKHRRSTICL